MVVSITLSTLDPTTPPPLSVIERTPSIDTNKHTVTLETGRSYEYDRLLLATGAEPVKLPIGGAELDGVLYLRTLADSRAIVARAQAGKRAVVIGSSCIGLEVAASLRAREVAVDVVAPETVPLERVMGAELGALIKGVNEARQARAQGPESSPRPAISSRTSGAG